MQTVEQIFDAVRKHFIYTPEGEQFNVRDDWRHHADEIGSTWRDDCDGFAATCCEIAAREGYEDTDIMFAICTTETGGCHAVAIIKGMVLDNRQRSVWPFKSIRYTWIKAKTVGGNWREMT